MSEQFLNEVAHEAPVGPLVDRLRTRGEAVALNAGLDAGQRRAA